MLIAKRSNVYRRKYDKLYVFNYKLALIKLFIRKGLKLYAFRVLNKFFFYLKMKYRLSINLLLNKVFNKYVPVINFIKKKIAANIYDLPVLINKNTAKSFLIRWFFKSVLSRTENLFVNSLINEFNDMVLGYGKTVKIVEDYYKLALNNRIYLRFLRPKRRVFVGRLKKYGVR